MIRLLNAGFERLRKNRVFLSLIIFSIVFALFIIYMRYNLMTTYGDTIEVEQIMFDYSIIIGIVISIFTSLFLGVEYSDGAIRNKLSIGHKRGNIYLSNLIIIIVTSLFFYVLFLLMVISIGIPLFGGITMEISKLLMLLLCTFVAVISYCSIFTFIAMIISNKTIISIVSIMSAFGLIMCALTCLNVLQTPKFIEFASISNGETGGVEMIRKPNPKYPSKTKRKVYQTLLDINPAGQMIQIVGRTVPNLKVLPIYSLGIIVVFTGAGLVLFKKKELK